jgi:BirA family biotin operon repressor/biotin-[acetyl-CoA-carboxylase] ligase
VIDPEQLVRRAAARGVPTPVWIDETTSTQDAVKTWAAARRPEGVSLVADHQTEGRGRLGRAWVAEPGEAVQLSVLLRPQLAPRDLPLLALAAGAAVYVATRGRLRLKWPNDLLGPDGRKVAGLLAEADIADGVVRWVVVGVGVNVYGAPAGVPDAGCLCDYGPPLFREELAVDLVSALVAWTRRVEREPEAVLQAWRRASCTLGARVRVGAVEGVAEDLADDGSLRVRQDDGSLVRIHAGDVQIVHTEGLA